MIQELMIINEAGLALFYHSFIDENETNDQQSLAGYFDIICKFMKNNFKESLKMLTLDNSIFFFYNHGSKYHLVLKCINKAIDERLLEDISESIIESFLKKYKDKLKNFNGEVSNFRSFAKIVQEIISTRVVKFNQAISLEL